MLALPLSSRPARLAGQRFQPCPDTRPRLVWTICLALGASGEPRAQTPLPPPVDEPASAAATPPLLEEPVSLETIEVQGRESDLLGQAGSASQGVVGRNQFRTRPLLRVGELVEVIPGMIATQHSGTGKANQYFLRQKTTRYYGLRRTLKHT